MAGTEGALRARLPWWPIWAAGALAVAAAGQAVALPAVAPLHPEHAPGVLAAISAVTAAGLTGVALRRARPRTPRTTLGRRASFPWTAVRICQEERLRHVHCLGPSGSGKTSSVLAPMLVQDLACGAGVAVVEIQGGELCSIARTWAERLGRPVLEWEPGNPESACWNPLADPSPAAAERLGYALQRIGGHPEAADHYAAFGGSILRHAVGAFASAGEPLDLGRLRQFLTDAPFHRTVMARVSDPDILAYFRSVFHAWTPEERLRHLQGVLPPLDALVAQPLVRRALCPPPGAVEIDLGRCLREGAVLLVRLPLGDMLRLAQALGTLFVSAFQDAVHARGPAEAPYYLYLDEFQHFCGPGFAEFLALARSRKVGAVLAHQNLAQLRQAGGTALEEAVLANAHTTVLLRCDGPDAARFAPWLPARGGRAWRPEDLSELPFGTGLARLSAGKRVRAQFVRLRYVGGRDR